MAFKVAAATVDAMLDAAETELGTAPILRLRTGSPPANVAAASTGTILAEMTLPSDFMAASSAGVKAKSGTWEDLSADAAGTVGHYEIVKSDGTTRRMQGVVTTTLVGTGDMLIDNDVLAVGQAVSVTAYSWTFTANV